MTQQPSILVTIVSFAAPQDAQLLAQWEMHLLPLQQAGRITLWSGRHILPQALRLDPNLAEAWQDKGDALQALGKAKEARAAYARARRLGG